MSRYGSLGVGRFMCILILVIITTIIRVSYAQAENGEISALEMRQECQGVESARLDGDELFINTSKFPHAMTCWGAFSTLHQLSLYYIGPHESPAFLKDVCPNKHGHGQKAIVLIRVFTHYVDENPREGGENFAFVAWKAFRAAWPCEN